MNRIVKSWWLACILAALPLLALAGGKQEMHGEDPFPLACTDFSGSWRSDKGPRYSVEQHGCSWLRIMTLQDDGENAITTIVPDNRLRSIPGMERHGSVRHRWNSPTRGTVIETYSLMSLGKQQVTELVTLEQVNSDLLLKSTYRAIREEDNPEPPRHEYEQEVFRRVVQPDLTTPSQPNGE